MAAYVSASVTIAGPEDVRVVVHDSTPLWVHLYLDLPEVGGTVIVALPAARVDAVFEKVRAAVGVPA